MEPENGSARKVLPLLGFHFVDIFGKKTISDHSPEDLAVRVLGKAVKQWRDLRDIRVGYSPIGE